MTQVVAAYQPCKPTSAGAFMVFTQHQAYFDQKYCDCFPREGFIEDLISDIERWQEQGGQRINMMDANEDIRSGGIQMA